MVLIRKFIVLTALLLADSALSAPWGRFAADQLGAMSARSIRASDERNPSESLLRCSSRHRPATDKLTISRTFVHLYPCPHPRPHQRVLLHPGRSPSRSTVFSGQSSLSAESEWTFISAGKDLEEAEHDLKKATAKVETWAAELSTLEKIKAKLEKGETSQTLDEKSKKRMDQFLRDLTPVQAIEYVSTRIKEIVKKRDDATASMMEAQVAVERLGGNKLMEDNDHSLTPTQGRKRGLGGNQQDSKRQNSFDSTSSSSHTDPKRRRV